jgi:anaerobic selenocysteine-containing dehydrogenase
MHANRQENGTMEENRQSTTRRQMLQASSLAAAAGLGISSQAKAQDKIAQSLVMYQATPKDGLKCTGCTHWLPPAGCAIVAGTINPNGWCGVYAPKA